MTAHDPAALEAVTRALAGQNYDVAPDSLYTALSFYTALRRRDAVCALDALASHQAARDAETRRVVLGEGRAMGLEEAALWHEREADQRQHVVDKLHGKTDVSVLRAQVTMHQHYATALRALIPQPPAPNPRDAERSLTARGWAPVNDGEKTIARECFGATESQATKTFIAGWPGGWPQAKSAGWRMSRVIITSLATRDHIADPRDAEIARLRKENADLKCSVVAFGAPWAVEYARDHGLPAGHLHPTHYDILAATGARMDSFTRAALATKEPNDAAG